MHIIIHSVKQLLFDGGTLIQVVEQHHHTHFPLFRVSDTLLRGRKNKTLPSRESCLKQGMSNQKGTLEIQDTTLILGTNATLLLPCQLFFLSKVLAEFSFPSFSWYSNLTEVRFGGTLPVISEMMLH